jgi:hypothetical protein
MPARLWDRASLLPAPTDGRPTAELVTLGSELPSLGELFTFARDAELRFETHRMGLAARRAGATGERTTHHDLLLRHPGLARVTTSEPSTVAKAAYEIWISDGETVRTYAAAHRLGTHRPVRRRIVGLDSPDLPGSAKVYAPLTPLPMETLADTFIHPAGFCQNVLATGECRIEGGERIVGREAIVVVCDHPRGAEIWADRPDHAFRVAFDRETGAILSLVETSGGAVTRGATVVAFEPNATLAPGAFDFEFPDGTTTIY